MTFVALFQGFLFIPFAHLLEHALRLVKFLDVTVPLLRTILYLCLPLLPVAIRELLRGTEAVKLGRLFES